ncbi:hypothetical protein J5N97_012429 [Dioscorea zingiberensis]|uniref:Dirigent protein n=1 Tax=Dioscorea zingiberensis TaxID=325984 RepID=A0A9D5CP12_9LILI|nr:hypothetical protein J5N97_012429 [Dioscorea zingiberensis]
MTGNSMATRSHPPKMEEKMTHLHFYMRYNFNGSNPTAIRVVEGPKNKTTLFGSILVMDNPVTAGPEMNTELIGRVQGFGVGVSWDSFNFLNMMNLVFTGGKYKGSTLSYQYRTRSELWIVGGTGKFRLARGYGMRKIYSYNQTTASSLVNSTILISILLCAMTGNSMATKSHHPKMEEKMTHLHFYIHFNLSNPTAVGVVEGPENYTTSFGTILVMDNPVTVGPGMETEHIGQAQGFAVGVSMENFNFLNIVNLVFTGGKYKGSTVSLQYRTTGELWIVGGTGKFRLARGYGMRKNYSVNQNEEDILEIDAFVLHY